MNGWAWANSSNGTWPTRGERTPSCLSPTLCGTVYVDRFVEMRSEGSNRGEVVFAPLLEGVDTFANLQIVNSGFIQECTG